MTPRSAVLLVGSAKASGASSSESLGTYLMTHLADLGVDTRVHHVNRTGRASVDAELADALRGADLFVLATPLYIDSFPYLVTRTLEQLARVRRSTPCAFAVIVNCGFPEASHCDVAIAIARNFARRAGFTWAGGLTVGAGGAIDGHPLTALAFTRRLRAALDRAAEALATQGSIPDEIAAEVARPMMPARLYTLMGRVGWYRKAAHNGALRQLAATPYQDDSDEDVLPSRPSRSSS